MNWKKRGYVLCCICFLLFFKRVRTGRFGCVPLPVLGVCGVRYRSAAGTYFVQLPVEEPFIWLSPSRTQRQTPGPTTPCTTPLEEKYSREPAVLENWKRTRGIKINLPEGTYEDYAGSRDVASLGKPKAYLEMRFEVNEEYTAKLRPGEYRLVKEYGGETLAAYFTLTEAPNDGTSSTSSSVSSGQEDDMTDGVMGDSSVAGYGSSEDSSASSGQEGDMANGVMEDPSVAGDGSSEDSSVPMASGVRGDE